MEKYKVCIIQEWIPQYRLPLFNTLREELKKDSIELDLIYGSSSKFLTGKQDSTELKFGYKVTALRFKLMGKYILWQNLFKKIFNYHLVILQPELKILSNYPLLLYLSVKGIKYAFWGHGKNFHFNSSTLAQVANKFLIKIPDRWFGYTEKSRDYLISTGFPKNRITVLNNTIETKELLQLNNEEYGMGIRNEKEKLSISSNNVGVFCGSFHPRKNIGGLLKLVYKIKHLLNDFEFIIIGHGEQVDVVKRAALEHNWIHYTGKLDGTKKGLIMKIATAVLLPYHIGLNIIDGFALGLPTITINNNTHSPEIYYLNHNYNGIISEDNEQSYVNDVIEYFRDDSNFKRMSHNCILTAQYLSMKKMVDNYKKGIMASLNGNQ